MSSSMEAFLSGFLICLATFLTISPVTVFLLRQTMRGHRARSLAITAWASDATLTVLGVALSSVVIEQVAVVSDSAAWLGAGVLFFYAIACFHSAARGAPVDLTAMPCMKHGTAILAVLALVWLNPQMIAESLVAAALFSASWPVPDRPAFAAGFMLATAIYYGGLIGLAGALTRHFRSPIAMRVFDVSAGLLLVAFAGAMVMGDPRTLVSAVKQQTLSVGHFVESRLD